MERSVEPKEVECIERGGTTLHRLQAKQCAPSSFSSLPPPSSASAWVLLPPLLLRTPLTVSSSNAPLSIARKASPSSANQALPDQLSSGEVSAPRHPTSGAQPTCFCHVGAQSLQRFFRCSPCCSCFCLRDRAIRRLLPQ